MSKNRKRVKVRSNVSYHNECLFSNYLDIHKPEPKLYVEQLNPNRFKGMPHLGHTISSIYRNILSV